jgi:hypothetical protein
MIFMEIAGVNDKRRMDCEISLKSSGRTKNLVLKPHSTLAQEADMH